MQPNYDGFNMNPLTCFFDDENLLIDLINDERKFDKS